MARERLTWQTKDADTNKQASPPPQTPNVTRTEGPDHPAYKADPNGDDYLIGDGTPSTFAEDVHPGPYDTAAAPATPGYQEPADHPAAKPGKPMKASEEERKVTERKAAKCIRIAASMFGEAPEGVSEEQHTATIENHALDLMDLPDQNIVSMLKRLGMEDDEDEDEGSDKEASISVTAAKDIVAAIDGLKAGLTRIAEHMGLEASSLFAMPMMDDMVVEDPMDDPMDDLMADAHGREQNDPEYGYAADDMDEEEMLAMMLSGMGHYAEDGKEAGELPPALKEHMKKKEEGNGDDKDDDKDDEDSDDDKTEDDDGKEGGKKAEDEAAARPGEPSDIVLATEDESEGDIVLAGDVDPMGMMDDTPSPEAATLAQLYMTAEDEEASAAAATEVTAAKKADDDEEEVEVEEEVEGSKKGASLKPQPKKPSNGAQALGTVQKVASSTESDLSSLWDHAPDVSSVFS